jgi:hypothetical protein
VPNSVGDMTMFRGFRSRWTIPCAWAAATPSVIFRMMSRAPSMWRRRVFSRGARPHQGIQAIPAELDVPSARPNVRSDARLVGVPILGGLHHDYRLAA